MLGRRMARRAVRRRVGHPLLRAAAIGGTGYYAGKKVAEGREAEAMQDQAITDLQDQVAYQQQAPAYAPPPQESYAPPPPQPAPAAAPASASGGGSDTVARLQELASLHASGVLTDDEFAAAKQKVLSGE